ncbi:MAG: hypothetical protein AAFY56_14870, partial [Pseudomonadota bacterium]
MLRFHPGTIFVLSVVLLAACDDANQSASAPIATPPPAVTTAPIVKKAITPETNYIASVEAINSVDLIARVEANAEVEGGLDKLTFPDALAGRSEPLSVPVAHTAPV